MYRTSSLARQIFRQNKITRKNIVSRSIATENSVLNSFGKKSVNSVFNKRCQNILPTVSFQATSYSTEPNVPFTRVTLPALSPTMERGTVVRWLKSVGERLEEGDLLAEIETDKATMGFETPDEGFLAAVFYPAGSKDIEIGKLICIVVENESDIAAFKNYTPSDTPASAPQAEQAKPATDAKPKSTKQYPEHLTVNLPALSPTMETGSLHGWQKAVGDRIVEGDVLVQIETDKATMDFETPDEGYLAKILIPAGEKNIPIGTLLCIIVSDKSDVAAFSDYTSAAAEVAAPVTATPPPVPSTPVAVVAPTPVTTPGGRVLASPLARRKALDKDIDLKVVTGTGPGGRITADDITAYVPSAKPTTMAPSAKTPSTASTTLSTDSYDDLPTSNIRQVIAKRLLESKTTIPHYYLSVDVDTSKLLKLRAELNKTLEADKVKLSVNDFIVKASALSCKKVPEANSSWQDSFIRQYKNVDINVAVATDSGLITPIVFNANEKGLTSINGDVARLATKAREGTLQPHEFMGGTFTISNLGMFGIKNFSAIINPPQACILAIGGTQVRLVSDSEAPNGVKETTVMSVTLSCDHRVVDGAVGALWLKQFKSFIENPQTMLL